jgi:DNA-binding NtrC family response regulator
MKLLYALIITSIVVVPHLQASESPFVRVALSSHDIEQCGGWPIPRRWYATFIQKVRAAGAQRIFIDIAFVSPDPLHPESDEYFYDILLQDENVFLLHPARTPDGSDVSILGDRSFPSNRVFSSFSAGFTFIEDHPLLKDSTSLTSALLRRRPVNEEKTVIDFPTALLTADHYFIDVLKSDGSFQGKDVILAVEYAGVTSFIVSPTGDKQSSSWLQVWAAEQIRQGNYSTLLDLWMYIVLLCTVTVPFIVRWTLRRNFHRIMYASALSAGLVIILFGANIFIPSWFLAAAAGWTAAGIVVFFVVRPPKTVTPPPEMHPDQHNTSAEELESLRYQLKYYEQLSQQLPPANDSQIVNSANIIHHPKSPLADILKKASQIAESSMPVLLTGESGTGKEKLAQFIHQQSARKEQPFIAVNCSSLNDSLIESELFGHEQGSFTGAIKTKIGRFELANGGTLFLDEIAETSSSFQAKILRVLQEGVVERVGGTKEIKVDVRIIAATNKNLKELTKKGTFREDLFYRLHGFELEIPALRERREDIEVLFRHFLYEQDPTLSYSTQLVDWLKEQRWQGNVRQLQSAVQRAVLNARMYSRAFIVPKDFELGMQPNADPMEEGKKIAENVLESLRSYRFDHKSIAKTSADLALHRSTVTEYLRGWVIHFLLHHHGDEQKVFVALQGSVAVEESERYQERIRAYIESIRTVIGEGIVAQESPEEIMALRFRKIPVPFRADILALIGHYMTVKGA